MANTITNFLVGLGFEFDKKGADQIDSSIDGIKSSALQLGAVVAGAFGIKSLTADFAASNDTLGKFSDTLGVTANDVNAFGNAIEHEGGTLQGFMSQLQGIEELRAGLLQGDAEFIAIAGKAGIDTTELVEATNATDAYLTLADQFAAMTTQQRLNAASALGLDEASIRLLSKGRDTVMQLVEVQRSLRPVTEKMTKAAADFNDGTQDLFNNVGRVADKISTALLPQVNSLITSTNEWFDVNQEIIDQNMDEALEPVVEHIGSLSVAGGLFATSGILGTFASLAKHIPVVGTGLVGIAGTLSTITGLGAAGATGFAIGNVLNEFIPEDIKEDVGRTTARVLATLGSEEAQQSLDIERRVLEQQGLEQPGIPIIEWDREQASEVLSLDLPQFLFNPIGQSPEVDDTDGRTRLLNSMNTNVEPRSIEPQQIELNADDVPFNVEPNMGDIPRIDDVPFNVEPNMGDIPRIDDVPFNVEPNMGVTPNVGDVPAIDPITMGVTPNVGDVPAIDPITMGVTPNVGDVPAIDPITMGVTPNVGDVPDVDIMPHPVDVTRERVERESINNTTTNTITNRNDERPININAKLNLDGQVIDQRIISVIDRQNQQALDDIRSNIRG